MATKKGIEILKQELLHKLATKTALNQVESSMEMIAGQVAQNSERVENLTRLVLQIREQIDGLENKADANDKFDLIMNAIDGLAAKINNYKVEKSPVDHSLHRHDSTLEDHKERISTLESFGK